MVEAVPISCLKPTEGFDMTQHLPQMETRRLQTQTQKAVAQRLRAFKGGTIAAAQQAAMERTLYRTIVFNRALRWEDTSDVALATDVDTLMEIYGLRSRVYKALGYDKEFPEIIEGMNFDRYDEHAAVLYVRKHGKVTATCRVIFDVSGGLPIDTHYSLDGLRKPHVKLAELSRLMIDKPKKNGLDRSFKHLTAGVYHVMKENGGSTLVSVMSPDHFGMYENFGGFEQKAQLSVYGNLHKPFVITAWEIARISPFFKRLFLGIRE